MAAIRVLVADDNDLVTLVLEEQLKGLGFDVVAIARTGVEAVDLTMRLHPDVIIMDIRMPEMDGIEATARINQQRPIPILMLTAYTDRDTVRKAEAAGAVGYMVKPINEAELVAAINIALARFRELQSLRTQVVELEESLEARKLVERAKGILMARLGLNERDAYERLRERARIKRAKMKDIAQAIIEAEELLGPESDSTTAEPIGQVLGLDSTIWQTFLSQVDEPLSETNARLATDLMRAIAQALKLPIVDDAIRLEDRLFMCQLDAASVFKEIGILSSVPLLCLNKREIHSADLDMFRHVLNHAFEQPKRVALLLIGQEERSQRTSELLEKVKRAYSLDIVPLCYWDAVGLLSAQEPQSALRSLILSQIDLVSVSPFVTMAGVPDVMFFGRESELRLIVDHARDVSYAVMGGRRIGKTSLLFRLHRVRLPAAGFRTIYHDCSDTATYDSFCAARIRSWRPQPPHNAATTFGALLQSLPTDKPLVLLLDEVDKLVSSDRSENWRLFNALRALANSGQVQVILSGERTLRDALREPSSPLFNFADELRLGPLDFHATAELITQPMKQMEIVLDEEELLVRQIYDFTSGHPNVIQRLCRHLIERLNITGIHRVTPDDVRIVLEDPNFQRDDFLSTYWEDATHLERIISLLMAGDDQARTLSTVQQSLRQRCNLQPKLREIDSALQLLVDIRSILKRTARGYEFAVASFPRAVADTVTLDDMLEILAEEFRDQQV